MDELREVQHLLAEPPPGPQVVEAARLKLERTAVGGPPPGVGAADKSWRTPGRVRGDGVPRHWPGWLAPVAAAAAVVAVLAASLGLHGVIARHHAPNAAASGASGAFAGVPPYFVGVPPSGRGHAVVGETATGAVLGTVAPPEHTGFRWIADAGDGRTFVLAAGAPPAAGTNALDWGPVSFYRLDLDQSGHPGSLVPLPVPPETAAISGLALSPDGSKLAVSLLPTSGTASPKIQVFSLATGAGQEWVWPGKGTIGSIEIGAGTTSGAWEADNRTLLFQVNGSSGHDGNQLRLLDTSAPAGSLLAASTQVPVPADDVGWTHTNATHRMGTTLITGDGTRLVAPFFHLSPKPDMFDFTITEFSVSTGQPVQVLYDRRSASEEGDANVLWVNSSGSAMLAIQGSVAGVQAGTTFTPLPSQAQRLLFDSQQGAMKLLPTW